MNNNVDLKKVDHIIDIAKKNAQKETAIETYTKILSLIDLTTLKETDNEPVIEGMCVRVNGFKPHFPHYENVAAICVYPAMVPFVKKHLKEEGVSIASVGGGFPASQTFLEIKTMECKMAVEAGAHEIDIVIPVGPFLAGQHSLVIEETAAIKKAIGNAHLKVILETGDLKPQAIMLASKLAMEGGANFIKTSTGKVGVSATHKSMAIMCLAIKDFYEQTGKKIGIKPAGGISEPSDAMVYYKIVEIVLGKDWLNKNLFRIGASRLANHLLEKITEISGDKKFDPYF